MSRELKRFLFDHYGGFANKNLRDVERDEAFQIDDFSPPERYDLYCHIRLRVNDEDTFKLSLENVPTNDELIELIEMRGPDISDGTFGRNISLRMTIADTRFVHELAKAVRRITRRGQRYKNSNWKWVCRTTSDSLDRLASCLEEYQRTRQAEPDEEDLFSFLQSE